MRLCGVTSSTAMRIIVLCVLSILSGTSVAMDETVSSLGGDSPSPYPSSLPRSLQQSPRYSSLINPNDQGQILGGKRAYVYRSEYKRLPLYQFGLGKRWVYGLDDKGPMNAYAYGSGKRSRHYDFGVGKRNTYDIGDNSLYNYGYIPNGHYNALQYIKDPAPQYWEAKRAGGFDFGLGKRVPLMVAEAEIPAKHLRDKYHFGLGKRVMDEEEEDEDEDEEEQ